MVAKSDLFKGYRFYIPTNVPTKIARNVQQQIIAHGGCCRFLKFLNLFSGFFWLVFNSLTLVYVMIIYFIINGVDSFRFIATKEYAISTILSDKI